jgi:signal-transduction protein with cAMP-binding, CBS, and nucleotidyltransferase domain
MFVESLLGTAAKRLVAVNDDIALIDAARPLSQLNVDLVVVCKPDGELAGVISKTDVVREICIGSGPNTTASQVMARDVVLCYSTDLLSDVWDTMKARRLKNLPVVGTDMRPIGVLNARDVLETLMQEAQYEEGLMRDYVMSVGYQ